jgi:phosphoglycerol transferase MdoB-like AlkP superfamily enzyme
MADKFKKWFIRKWEPSDILFSIYLVAFFTFGTFLFTLRVEHIEGVAMIFAFGMSGLFLVCACFLQVGIPHFCKIFSPAPVGKIKLT